MAKQDKQPAEPIRGALALDGDPETLRDYYANWATDYDADVEAGRYTGPRMMMECLERAAELDHAGIDPLNLENRIHDVGCGTGLVGELLAKYGFRHIDGSDLSTDMVEVAGQRGIYRALTGNADITKPLPDAWRSAYELVLCCGVFTCGHVPPESLHTLLDMAIPGGLVVLSTRTRYYDDTEFQRVSDEVVASGRASLLLNLRDAPYTDDGRSHYWVYEVAR